VPDCEGLAEFSQVRGLNRPETPPTPRLRLRCVLIATRSRHLYDLSMSNNLPGILIAFEGIDGAGKTTQVELLTQLLVSRGERVVRSKEPTDGAWGRKIRASATSGRMSLADELNAFIEDRKEHVANLIRPTLAAGGIVILDRYYFSTIAYQGARGANVDELREQMLRIAPPPDVVFLIDLDPQVGLSRISDSRGEVPNDFERLEPLTMIRRIFLDLAAADPTIRTIDGSRAVDLVHEDVKNGLLEGVLARKRPGLKLD